MNSLVLDFGIEYRGSLPDLVSYIAHKDCRFAIIATKAVHCIELSQRDKRYAFEMLGSHREPLAFRITRYLDTLDPCNDLWILENSDIAERLLTGDIEDDHYYAMLEGRMGIGGGRAARVDVNSFYRFHPIVHNSSDNL